MFLVKMNSYVLVFMLVLLTTSGADTAVLVTLAVIATPALSLGWACTRHSGGGGGDGGREGQESNQRVTSTRYRVLAIYHYPNGHTTVTWSLTFLACADAAVHTTVSRTLALCRLTAAVH